MHTLLTCTYLLVGGASFSQWEGLKFHRLVHNTRAEL